MLSVEDQLIYNWLCEIWFQRYQRRGLFSTCLQSDKRDSTVMLNAQSQRWCELRLSDGLAYADRKRFPVPYLVPIRQDCGPVGGDITKYA